MVRPFLHCLAAAVLALSLSVCIAAGADVQPDVVLDACPNVDGFQEIVPDEMLTDESGQCVPYDSCPNLDGMQTEVPQNMTVLDEECVPLLALSAMRVSPAAIVQGQAKLPSVSVRSTRYSVVRVSALRPVSGYRVRGKCQKARPAHPAHPPRCTFWQKLAISQTDQVVAGKNMLRLRSAFWRQLAPGRYRIQIQASDSGESVSMLRPFSVKAKPKPKPPVAPPSDEPPLQPVGPEDVDCSDIGHPVTVLPGDPDRLDADGDGIGCEAS
jgi:hypothetical protein